MPSTTYEERVAAGAALLDEKFPGWDAQIDLATLDIQRYTQCIGGQLCGTYWIFQEWIEPWGREERASFNSEAGVDDPAELTAAWRRHIAVRRFAHGALKPTLLAV